MLILPLGASRWLALVLVIGHISAALCVLNVPLPAWLKISLYAVLTASLAHSLTRDVWRKRGNSIVELHCNRDGGAIITMRNGVESAARVLGSSFVTAYLTIVLLKLDSEWRVRAVVILPDAVQPERFRQLRVWLKWRVGQGVEPEASAGWAGRI